MPASPVLAPALVAAPTGPFAPTVAAYAAVGQLPSPAPVSPIARLLSVPVTPSS